MTILPYLYRKQLATRAVINRPRYLMGAIKAHDKTRVLYNWSESDEPDRRGKTTSADQIR